MSRPLRIGAAPNPVAQANATVVVAELQKHHAPKAFAAVSVKPRPYKISVRDLGMTAEAQRKMFRTLEKALVAGRLQAVAVGAVDLPAELPGALAIAAVAKRPTPWDALISRDNLPLDKLAPEAKIGTSHWRRTAQLLDYCSTFRVSEIRGNLAPQLKKLGKRGLDALVLPAAQLGRLGLRDRVTEELGVHVMVPAAGQGSIAVLTKARDEATRGLLKTLEDPLARAELTAERAVVREMGGLGDTSLGVVAVANGGALRVDAVLATPGRRVVRTFAVGPTLRPEQVAATVAQELHRARSGHIVHGLKP